MSKKNCWELKKCGKEMNGGRKTEDNVCPASAETKLNGVHGGINAGRACWIVNGTLCKGKHPQGVFEKKYVECLCSCNFLQKVKSEEKDRFHLLILTIN